MEQRRWSQLHSSRAALFPPFHRQVGKRNLLPGDALSHYVHVACPQCHHYADPGRDLEEWGHNGKAHF